jgi:hypothetical protein
VISIIINTCAGTKDPEILERRGSRDNTGKRKYAERAAKLREMLGRYRDLKDVEIIVVGEWESGEGYRYIHDPGKLKDPSDQAQQRHTGMQAAKGSVILFLNDDHYVPLVDFKNVERVAEEFGASGVAYRCIQNGDDNGLPHMGLNLAKPYIPGHASIFKREVIEAAPWSLAAERIGPTDVLHTESLEDRGFKTNRRTDLVRAYDIEIGAFPEE